MSCAKYRIADHDLAIFCEGDGGRFQIDAGLSATGVVSSPLRLLAETRRQIEGHSLFDAVKILVVTSRSHRPFEMEGRATGVAPKSAYWNPCPPIAP